VAECVSGSIEVTVVAVELVAPDDGGGMSSNQGVAQSRFGALAAHWGTLENEPDNFKAFCMGAAGQFVVFQLDLL
jgi:hypothetical protein